MTLAISEWQLFATRFESSSIACQVVPEFLKSRDRYPSRPVQPCTEIAIAFDFLVESNDESSQRHGMLPHYSDSSSTTPSREPSQVL